MYGGRGIDEEGGRVAEAGQQTSGGRRRQPGRDQPRDRETVVEFEKVRAVQALAHEYEAGAARVLVHP